MVRRLTTILAADLVGYSRLMAADEEGVIERLRSVRSDVIDPALAAVGARIVKTMGDGLLVEFSSPVEAVRTALIVQKDMLARESTVPEENRFQFRIGINLGDVMLDGDDLLGDAVNVAARLEALASPGGICISGTVHDQVQDRLNTNFEPMGNQMLKNIDRPVPAWQWPASDTEVDQPIHSEPQSLELPKKPSIAVLAFENLSGDPEQVYFADGIAGDIITALSRSRDLFVIARNSSFSYRDKSVDLRKVGQELGVRFVLEGSVRRAGNRVRITAQLIEADTGSHVWAEKYDRPIEDIFDVQDEITINVAGTVGSEIRSADLRRVAAEPMEKLQTWERLMKAYWHINKLTSSEVQKGQDICRKEISADGGEAPFHAAMTLACAWELIWNLGNRPPADIIKEGIEAGRKAIELDAADETARSNLSILLWICGQHEEAESQARTAVELNPMHIGGRFSLASVLAYSGSHHFDEAMEHLNFALRLGPRDINLHYIYCHMAMACFIVDRNEEATKHAQAAIRHFHNNGTAFRILAAALANDNQIEAAQNAWKNSTKFQQIDTVAVYRVFKRATDAEKFINALGIAGGTLN